VLRSARLVRERRDGRGRFYRLDAVPLRTLDEWVSDYRLFWQMRLEELKAYVEAMPSERPAQPATPSPSGRRTVRAQRRGRPR
jgi:hypothetical protein